MMFLAAFSSCVAQKHAGPDVLSMCSVRETRELRGILLLTNCLQRWMVRNFASAGVRVVNHFSDQHYSATIQELIH
jgi:hypothetical protein